MNDHLTECQADNGAQCICPELRACEERAFHRGFKAGVDVERDNTIKYGQRRYREALEDAKQEIIRLSNKPDASVEHYLAALTELIKNPRIL